MQISFVVFKICQAQKLLLAFISDFRQGIIAYFYLNSLFKYSFIIPLIVNSFWYYIDTSLVKAKVVINEVSMQVVVVFYKS